MILSPFLKNSLYGELGQQNTKLLADTLPGLGMLKPKMFYATILCYTMDTILPDMQSVKSATNMLLYNFEGFGNLLALNIFYFAVNLLAFDKLWGLLYRAPQSDYPR